MFVTSLLVCLILVASQCEAFSYDRLDEWPKEFCGGENQSPINIEPWDATQTRLKKLDLTSYSTTPISKLNLTNNGHTVVGTFRETIVITGGPMASDNYQLKSFHFHFGEKENDGTEHAINGERYAIEIHFVHVNVKYPDLLTALRNKDGVVVVAVIGRIDRHQKFGNCYSLSLITDNLAKVENANEQTVVQGPLYLSKLIPNIENGIDYYTYAGSLTTPNCDEAVTFIINSQKLKLSNKQVRTFDLLRNNEGKPMSGNVRPLQALNGRIVKHVRGY